MSGRTRSKQHAEENSANNRDFPSLQDLGDDRNLTRNVEQESDEMEVDSTSNTGNSGNSSNSGNFIFARQIDDNTIQLVNDPLERYSIEEIPGDVKAQMEKVYDICCEKLGNLDINRAKMIINITEQVLDAVLNSPAAKDYAKPPFTHLITHILDTNLTVNRQNFLFPAYTFHKIRVGSADSKNLIEKVYFMKDLEFKLLQRLNQIKEFSEKFANCHSLQSVIQKVASPSALTDLEEITAIFDHMKDTILNPRNTRECWDRCWELPMPNTDAAKFVKLINKNNSLLMWYLFIALKGKNHPIFIKTMTYYFGRFKEGETVKVESIINDVLSSPGFSTDMQGVRVVSAESFKKIEKKNNADKGNKFSMKRPKSSNGPKSNFKKPKTDKKSVNDGQT